MIRSTEPETLAEMLFHAEQFCLRVENAVEEGSPNDLEAGNELRLKLGQARNILAALQQAFEADELRLAHGAVRANYRWLVMTLLWIAFHSRHVLDFRTYRMLVMIESSFTYLLNLRR